MNRHIWRIALLMLSLATLPIPAQVNSDGNIEILRKRHIFYKLKYPNKASTARNFNSELSDLLRNERAVNTESDVSRGFFNRFTDNFESAAEHKEQLFSFAVSFVPGSNLLPWKKFYELNDETFARIAWENGIGANNEYLAKMTNEFIRLENNGKLTTVMRKLAVDLEFLPANSKVEEYTKDQSYTSSSFNYPNGLFIQNFAPNSIESSVRVNKETLLKKVENVVGHPISEKSLQEKIEKVPQFAEKVTNQKVTVSPLQEMQRHREAQVRRAIRADIYNSFGTLLSPFDSDLGKVVAVGFPAVDRLLGGLSQLATAGFSMVAFADVLGGAAALANLVRILSSGPDQQTLQFNAIQKGLGTVSKQISVVDTKVNHIIGQLNELAMMQIETQQQLTEIAAHLEEMHIEVLHEIDHLSSDINRLARYMQEKNRNDVLDQIRKIEDCYSVYVGRQQQGIDNLEENNIFESDFRNCRRWAFSLASDVARRDINAGEVLPQDLRSHFIDPEYTPEQAMWVAKHWRDAALSVRNARKDALDFPSNYGNLFENDDGTAKGVPVVPPRNGSYNPKIWYEGVEQYVKLERLRSQDITGNERYIKELLGSGKRMQALLNVIDSENFAYDAMELHLWNGHLLVQVLQALWNEYLYEKVNEYEILKDENGIPKLDDDNRPIKEPIYKEIQHVPYAHYDLLFKYWLNDYEERYLPMDDPEKHRSMVLIATANEKYVPSEIEIKSSPRVHYKNEVRIDRTDGNFVLAPGLFKRFMGVQEFVPAIYGKVSASWKGCYEVELKYKIKNTEAPFGIEEKKICVDEDALERSFPEPDRKPRWCRLMPIEIDNREEYDRKKFYLLNYATYETVPMKQGYFSGIAFVREGSLVLNQIGLQWGWDNPDPTYSKGSGVKRAAYQFTTISSPGFWNIDYGLAGFLESGDCKIHALWGIPTKKNNFFSNTLKVKTTRAKHPEFIIANTTNGHEFKEKVEKFENDDEGAILLFQDTESNRKFIRNNLAELVFNQEVAKIFDTAKRTMNRSGDSTIVPNFEQLKHATQMMMSKFVIWVIKEHNKTKKVELDWGEVVGYPYNSINISLKEVLQRLNESWKAVQILSRLVSGSCSYTPGGISFQALTSKLASGDVVESFLKGNSHSWREFRKHGLLGVSFKGLYEDADRLREKIGALDRWPLHNEFSLLTYDEGAILLASVDAAMELIRLATREHASKATAMSDKTFATIARGGFEEVFKEQLISIREGANGIEIDFPRQDFKTVGLYTETENYMTTSMRTMQNSFLRDLTTGVPTAPMHKDKEILAIGDPTVLMHRDKDKEILATGVPIAWMHKDKEISAIDFAIKKVSNLLSEDLKSENSPELVRLAEADLLSLVQNSILDILEKPQCKPGISEFEDGIKLLESIGDQ